LEIRIDCKNVDLSLLSTTLAELILASFGTFSGSVDIFVVDGGLLA
jgi:hypothetical protein